MAVRVSICNSCKETPVRCKRRGLLEFESPPSIFIKNTAFTQGLLVEYGEQMNARIS